MSKIRAAYRQIHGWLHRQAYGVEVDAKAVSFDTVLRRELELVDRKRRLRRQEAAEPSAATVATPADAAETDAKTAAKTAAEAVAETRAAAQGDGDVETAGEATEAALERDLFGLAFSGGGIRSATFNLGVLQGLADLRLLRHVDYLSTVSGGGYIGSWLVGWLHRLRAEGRRHAIQETEASLAADGSTHGGEPAAVTFLRRYSNYLTPKVGALSTDTWTVVTTYLRNLILNLVLLVASLAVLLVLPRFVVGLARLGTESSGATWGWMAAALVLGTIAVVFVGVNIGSFNARHLDTSQREFLSQTWIQVTVILPLLLAAFCAARWLASVETVDFLSWYGLVALAYAGAWGLAGLVAWGAYDRGEARRLGAWIPWLGMVFCALPTGLVGAGLLLTARLFLRQDEAFWAPYAQIEVWKVVTWGPGLVLLTFTSSAVLHIGLMGRGFHDFRREWLARSAAWALIYGLGWTGLFALVTYGPPLFFGIGGWLRNAAITGWVVSTLGGLLVGRSQAENGSSGSWRGLVAKAAPYVFIAGMLLGIATAIDKILGHGSQPWQDFLAARALESGRFAALCAAHFDLLDDQLTAPVFTKTIWLFLLFAGILALMGWRVDVNEFSMHRFYRNRLVRCFLGASVEPTRRQQERQPFTGFNHQDDVVLADLEPAGLAPNGDTHAGPYPLINATLNLVGGDELAWQERKAAAFVLAPLYCGWQIPGLARAYRPTRHYGRYPKELTLGSALAVSGAAASPNMGYHSSPAMAFLLTVFNVRLGWWLGNPAHEKAWTRSGPAFALLHLVGEMLGWTREDQKFVYLSDGGHFENLGIYELVRRRCRFIVACDASADPDGTFEDLGNAIRKCRSDLGAEIEIQLDPLRRQAESGWSPWHCAVGKIRYRAEGEEGTLLYIKASLTGDEPEDVRNYAADHREFPHQSTADQFFEESQFESYRALGRHVAHAVLAREAGDARRRGTINVERLVSEVRQRWHPPSRGTASFTRHTETLDRLFERARRSSKLAFLDGQFYPEWGRLQGSGPLVRLPLWLPTDPEELRQGFYFCNSLIQLMENVYFDLDLAEEHGHPDNRGWMNLFKHWSWSGMFRATWAITAATFGQRFQSFCESHLDLTAFDRLEVARVDVKGRGRQAIVAAVAASPELNPLEKAIVLAYAGEKGNRVSRIYALQVAVASPLDASAPVLRFGCGFALARGRRIVLFRIQDHLRKMGLARSALRRLVRDEGLGEEPVAGRVPAAYEGLFLPAGERQLRTLFRSVKSELTAGVG